MNVICLIRDEPPLRYFANRIHQAQGVDLVVVEEPTRAPSPVRRTLEYARREGVRAMTAEVRLRAQIRSERTRRRTTLERRFGDLWRRLDADIPLLRVRSVNEDEVVRRLRELAPVAVLDHGTSVVREPVLGQADLTLNLHWGLSPYYRGVRCTEWALIMWDPANIGVTVHSLTSEIDGGAIAGQKRAMVKADDTVHSLNMQLTYLGTEIVADALARIGAGQELPFVEQDLSEGILTNSRQWSALLGRHVRRIERDGTLARMLDAPSRGPQPIVSLT
jgi:folate-dependent phosphoribosylglycinamide formyltransferase PurN